MSCTCHKPYFKSLLVSVAELKPKLLHLLYFITSIVKYYFNFAGQFCCGSGCLSWNFAQFTSKSELFCKSVQAFPLFFHCVYKIESGFSTTLLVTAFSVLTSKTSVIVITHNIFVIRRSPAVNGRKENGGKIEQHPRPGQTNFPRTKVPGLKV